MIKAYVKSDIPARSIQRISTALSAHCPSNVKIVDKPDLADLVVHIVIGVQNFADTPIDRLIEDELIKSQRYAIIQCCLISTEEKKPDFWKPLWTQAEVVWSYLDLNKFAPTYNFSFYYAPLGVDGDIFNRSRKKERDITMLTTGYVPESEGIREVAEAVRRVGGKHVNVGPDFRLGPHSRAVIDVSDEEMADLYSRSLFVAGLRRDEGFELPAAEGLACGAQPIMFDAPHYRQWFDGLAIFIPEDCQSVVTSSIESVFKFCQVFNENKEYVESTNSKTALEKFNWKTVTEEFWKRCLVNCE